MKNEIGFYSAQNSERLKYVLKFVEQLSGNDISVITDVSDFNNFDGAKINYSAELNSGLQINPHTLLFEENIRRFDFKTLESDPLAMIFFLLSRYEEYLPFTPDKYGRFQARESYVSHADQIMQPAADKLVAELKDKLQQQYPDLAWKKPSFERQITIDIDQAFLYQHKSLKRFVGGTVRDSKQFKPLRILDRKLSYFGLKRDPWNIYADLQQQFRNQHTVFFFQVGDYGPLDKNLPYTNAAFRKVIRETAAWSDVGLHPSFQSNEDIEILKLEKRRLEEITGKEVTRSRQHYIKFTLPETYRNLLNIGITDDYSMGFPDTAGFRAGTAHSFQWYDLQAEKITGLTIHPFCVMDVTMKDYMNMRPEHTDFVLQRLQNEVRQTGGVMSMIFHNESLSGYGDWKNWNTIFFDFINS